MSVRLVPDLKTGRVFGRLDTRPFKAIPFWYGTIKPEDIPAADAPPSALFEHYQQKELFIGTLERWLDLKLPRT